MNNTELEQKMLEESMANHGCLDLDFHNPEHYLFLLNRLGGEAHLQKHAPDLYWQLKKQHSTPASDTTLHKQEENFIHLRPFHQIDAPAITVSSDNSLSADGSSYSLSTISCTLRTSDASDSISNVTSDFRVYDKNTGLCMARDYYDLTPDEHGQFALDVDFSIPLEQQNLEHAYQFSSLFLQTASLPSNEVLLSGKYVTSTIFTVNASQYIKKMKLYHPIIRTERTGQQAYNDCICISYNRYANIGKPDYTYKVSLDHSIHTIPVHIPFYLEIELTDEAGFESVNDSYFDNSWNPQIWLMNLENENMEPLSTGASPFLADWVDFSENHVTASRNPVTGKINKLTIFFENKEVPAPDPDSKNEADLWPADLTAPLPDQLWDIATYAAFYANISLNISYGSNRKTVLPILVQFIPGMTPSNETKPGENALYIPRLYFQWGCFAKDTLLYRADGSIPVQDVQIGDALLTREGSYRVVRDMITGPSDSIYRFILANGSELEVTEDHTLCLSDGTPVAACNVRTGDLLQTYHVPTGTLYATEVVASIPRPYHDTVYNFVFDEPTFLIAQGVIAGDHAYQQKVRPVKLSTYKIPKPNPSAEKLASQWKRAVATQHEAAPDFIESNAPQTALFYYCSLKALLSSCNLYTEEEAQEIAEFCAFMESNATYGGVKIDESEALPDKINERNLYINADTGFYVKLIPTAMEKWYDTDELLAVKTWEAPTSPDPSRKGSFSYRVREDILVPFHYPVEEKTPSGDEDASLVQFCPSFLQEMLEDIMKHSGEGKLPEASLHMGLGFALHLVLDSMLHESYSGLASWQNMKRRINVFDHNRKDVSNLCSIYKDYPYEEFTSNEKCPTGIEQTGSCTELPFVLFDYSFPLDSSELSSEKKVPPYNGYKTFVNSTRFCRALKYVLSFLYRYKGKTLDELTWKNRFEEPLNQIFEQTLTTPDAWCKAWRNGFGNTDFSYQPEKIYKRLTDGQDGSHSELFACILILNQIQNGGNLYD